MDRKRKRRPHPASAPTGRRRRARRPDATAEARRQSALAQLGELALDTEATDPLLEAACALVRQALDCDAAAVGERTSEALVLRASTGLPPERRRDRLPPPAGEGHHLAALGFGAGAEVALPGRLRPPLLLGAYRLAARPFGAGATRFLEGVARLLAAALVRARAEHELLERERLLRAAWEARPEPELLVDDAGAVREANAAACQLLGRDRRGVLGRGLIAGGTPLDVVGLAAAVAERGPEVEQGLALAVAGGAPLPVHVSRLASIAPGLTGVRLRPAGPQALRLEVRAAEVPLRPAEQGGRRPRVLVVDDEPLVGMAVARSLGEELDVTVVEGAHAALARIESGERFDAILADLLMPEMSGLDLYRALADQHPVQARRLAMLTGVCEGEVRAALQAASIPWLEKPFELGALRRLVAERASR